MSWKFFSPAEPHKMSENCSRHKAGIPGRDKAWGMRIPLSSRSNSTAVWHSPFTLPSTVTLTGWVKDIPNTLGAGLGDTLHCRTCFGFHAWKNWLLFPNYASVLFSPPCWRVGTRPSTSFYSLRYSLLILLCMVSTPWMQLNNENSPLNLQWLASR